MTKPFGLTFLAFVASAFALAACPSPKMPTGPSPEYEDPPRPSWMEAGAPAPATAAPTIAPAPLPGPAPGAPLPQDASAD